MRILTAHYTLVVHEQRTQQYEGYMFSEWVGHTMIANRRSANSFGIFGSARSIAIPVAP